MFNRHFWLFDRQLYISRLKSKTKVLALYIREAQYADDVAIFSDTPAGLQILLTAYNVLARKMDLYIMRDKGIRGEGKRTWNNRLFIIIYAYNLLYLYWFVL